MGKKKAAFSGERFWKSLASGLGETLVRGLPAVSAIERDGRLVRDALLHVAIAAEFPLAPAMAVWRGTKGNLLARLVEAVPELLEVREVRLWLGHWAAGAGKLRSEVLR